MTDAMSDFDADAFAAAWREHNERERRLIRERSAEARKETARLAERIANDAGAERVVHFGSLAEDTVRRLDFDIDLAIRGGDWFRARGVADESSFRVDLVELERLPEHIRSRVEERGITVWPLPEGNDSRPEEDNHKRPHE